MQELELYAACPLCDSADIADLRADSCAGHALYQPALFGDGVGVATVTGAWVSYLTTKVSDELFPARSVQLPPTGVLLVSGPL